MVESLCQLLRTIGQPLDVPKASAHMDAYFQKMRELCKSTNVSPRMQFMPQVGSSLFPYLFFLGILCITE
ncbi:hypothetical protein EDC04DRAFT_2801977 [Pisolithus marmoratus]|nr:hypothetical protein EDC04DRAFT_2801977 [Pisolithus marmoratus]